MDWEGLPTPSYRPAITTDLKILKKQINASDIQYGTPEAKGSITVVVGTDKFYLQGNVSADVNIQKDALLKDIAYYEGFLLSVEKKLGNERFIQNAKPEVIDLEKKKKSDAEAKLNSLRETLNAL